MSGPGGEVAPAAGEHGGDGARLAAALGVPVSEVLDLSASLNPVAPDPGPVVARHIDAIGSYPDPEYATRYLSEALGVQAERLVLTNGGAEAIALVAAELGPGRVDEPDFSLYRRHLPAVDPSAGRWRSNPHNPTGALAAPGDTAAVWDEAFWPLATGTWTRGDAERGSVVLGSLTKLLACPGLRVGYVVCPDAATASALRRRQPRWAVNALVCAALPELLTSVDLPAWARQVAALRSQLESLLMAHGLSPQPSAANWLLVHAPRLREQLARQAILVRDCASFGMPGTVRIAVPPDAGLLRLAEALDQRR